MTPLIVFLLGISAIMTVAGAVMAWIAIRHAPDGRETEQGWEMIGPRSIEPDEREDAKAAGTHPQFS